MGKSQLIYQYIRAQQSVSKQDIVLGLKFSLPTITQNLQYLTKLGLIDTSQKIQNTGGRNATAYTYQENARAAIGVYLTANHINTVAVNLSGDVMEVKKEKRKFDLMDEEYLIAIGDAVEEVKEKAEISDENLLGVGIALQSLVSEDGEVVQYGMALDFTGATREHITKYIPYKNRLFHDSKTAGFAEVWIDSGLSNTFYLSLSNSVGGAFLQDNAVYMGNTHKSGEVGHVTAVLEGGTTCYCGKKGCFDTVCSSLILEQYTDGNLEQFFEVLKAGDPGAKELWDTYLYHLANGIHTIRMLFDSDIIIGGYVGAYIEEYKEALCKLIDEKDPFGDHAKDYLIPCKFKVEAAAAGAALSYIDKFFLTI